MKTTIIFIVLVAMTIMSTEALTLHAPGPNTVSSGQGKNGMDDSLSSTSYTIKRTTPDFSSSSLTTPIDRLVTKRLDKKGTEQVTTCQDYINGIESVLVSIEVSMDEVREEVTDREPAKNVLAKLTEIEDLVTHARTDTEAAKKTEFKTQTTMDTLVSTASNLHTKLGENEDLLGKATSEATSEAYKDLMMYAGNIESYAKDYVKKGCVAAI
ncbi:hypothetical protein BKA57DRAFT_489756 [Linnemannia elongata]|nr:hypothetical protein BKA57DRAFT_489756 [Linnemannia elongata]